MIVPGSNLLKMANRLIKFQSVQYYTFKERSLNSARQWVASFNPPFPLSCSVQAVDRKSYAAMGLDFNAFYVNVWASLNLIDLERDSSGDRFVYRGELYQMAKGQNWHAQDGWAQCLATRIDPNPLLVNPL